MKRDLVWLESIEVGEQCDKIVLLGEDGGQAEVPALLLLAASPVVRIIFYDRLPSSHGPVVNRNQLQTYLQYPVSCSSLYQLYFSSSCTRGWLRCVQILPLVIILPWAEV